VNVRRSVLIACVILASGAPACSGSSGEDVEKVGLRADAPLPARRGIVVVDGCELDAWQRATLSSAPARKVLSQVVMLCLVPRVDGTVGPRDPSATKAIANQAADLKGEGYRFDLAVSFTDETGARYDGLQTRAFLADPAWRAQFRTTLAEAMTAADGVALDMQDLPNDARADVTSFVNETSTVVRGGGRKLDVFVPPSVSVPSDLPGGDAFALADLAPFVDRFHVSTLDYSTTSPGPTLDSGWAVDAIRTAMQSTLAVDVSVPLYGTDFGPRGHRTVSYLEATGAAAWASAPIVRSPSGALTVRWTSADGAEHETWFDDAESTARALGAWSLDVLPSDVGVVFYGLGAEDPSLWNKLAERTP
jgi:spore germination protein YaaH